jgi:hypothetical protein
MFYAVSGFGMTGQPDKCVESGIKTIPDSQHFAADEMQFMLCLEIYIT